MDLWATFYVKKKLFDGGREKQRSCEQIYLSLSLFSRDSKLEGSCNALIFLQVEV